MPKANVRLTKVGLIALACVASLTASIPKAFTNQKKKSQGRVVTIGLSSANKSVVSVIPYPEYRETLSLALNSVNDSMVPVLEKHAATEQRSATGWHINSIGVGLGLKAEIGVGPLLNVSISPNLRLIFSDSTNPIYPN